MSHGSSWMPNIPTATSTKQVTTCEQKYAEKHQFRTFLAGEALFWGLELVFSACWSHEHLLVLVDLPASCREKKCGACFHLRKRLFCGWLRDPYRSDLSEKEYGRYTSRFVHLSCDMTLCAKLAYAEHPSVRLQFKLFQILEQSNYEQNHSQHIMEVHWAKQNFQNCGAWELVNKQLVKTWICLQKWISPVSAWHNSGGFSSFDLQSQSGL